MPDIAEPPAQAHAAPEITEISLENLSQFDPKTLAAAQARLFGDKPVPPEPAPVADQAKVNPDAGPAPKGTPEPSHDDDGQDTLPRNFRFHTEDPKLAKFLMTMRANPDKSPVEVAKLVGYEIPPGTPTPPKADDPAPDRDAPAAPVAGSVEALELEVQGLQDELAQYDDQGQLPEGRAIVGKIARTVARIEALKIRDSENETRHQQETAAERNRANENARAEVLREYPTASDPRSALGKEITALVEEIQADPSHQYRSELGKLSSAKFVTELAVKNLTDEYRADGFSDAQIQAKLKGPVATRPDPTQIKPPGQAQPVPRNLATTSGRQSAPDPSVTVTAEELLQAATLDPKLRARILFPQKPNVRR